MNDSKEANELSIIQKTYDFIKWYVPILCRLPKDRKFILGDRTISQLYDVLENLIVARYAKQKLAYLEPLNGRLDILRYQTRLLFDFELIDRRRYEYASRQTNEIGIELGGWIRQQRRN